MTGPDAATAVTACGQAATAAAPRLAAAPDGAVDAALHGMARLLGAAAPAVLAANAADVAAGEAAGLAALVNDALRRVAPVISLYVNDYNRPARAAYRRVGFTQTATFASVLF